MAVKILPGMNLLDAAIASAGSVEDLFAFARLNGLGYSDQPAPGSELKATGLVYLVSSAPSVAHLVVKPVAVMEGQTLADLAMQQLGSVEALFALARLNGLAVTAELTNGQVLNYSITPFNKQVLKIYADGKLKPASATTLPGQEQPDQLTGIDYWIIENDFIVS